MEYVDVLCFWARTFALVRARPLGLLCFLFVVVCCMALSHVRALNAVLLLGAACTHSVVTSRQRRQMRDRHLISILRTLALANYPGDAQNVSGKSCFNAKCRPMRCACHTLSSPDDEAIKKMWNAGARRYRVGQLFLTFLNYLGNATGASLMLTAILLPSSNKFHARIADLL